MVEKVKNKKMPLLVTILLAFALIVSGFSVLGVETVQSANATAKTESSGDGMDEDVSTSSTYDFSNVSTSNNQQQKYVDLAYNGSYHTVYLKAGTAYTFEVWGAQGADGKGTGGKGGYAKGTTATLTADMTVYVYVGGQGKTTLNTVANAGYNGGGQGHGNKNATGAAGGGGATDIRLTSGAWNNSASLNSRVIVAGGGGGGGGTRYGNLAGGVGGGTNGGTPPNNKYCGSGGSQTAAGTNSTTNGGSVPVANYGGFGFGGSDNNYQNESDLWQGGGGGGWYGGIGGTAGGPGSGGSGYVLTSSSHKPSGYTGYNSNLGYLTSTSLIAGNTSLPVTTINSTSKETGHSGNGFARITQLNAPPAQHKTPSFSLNRSGNGLNALLTGTADSNGLQVYDPEGKTVSIANSSIYTAKSATNANRADLGANCWISYSQMSVGGTTLSNLKAMRWWSGSKTFYFMAKDDKNSTAWLQFTATCDQGTINMGSTLPSTSANTEKYRWGVSNTNDAANAGKMNGATQYIYNPVTGRNTVWLADAVSADGTVYIKANELFKQTNTNDVVLFESTTSNITYDTKRYAMNGSNNAGQLISNATNNKGSNSSYFTNAAITGEVKVGYHNGSGITQNYVRGGDTLELSAVKGRAAGSHYYKITVKVMQVCKYGGTKINTSPVEVDIVYRVDNTRPKITVSPNLPHVTVKSGTTESIYLNEICNDVDGNSLRIVDLVVPSGEWVYTTQYGEVISLTDADNKGNLNKYYQFGAAGLSAPYGNAIITSAQNTGVSTGFKSAYVYQTVGANADTSFRGANGESSTQPAQGNERNAYIGYYVNTAITENGNAVAAGTKLSIVGNKATRNMYRIGDGTPRAIRDNCLGDFYILVRVQDSGDTTDKGIWFPVAITVTSSAPQAANYPSVNGNAGDEFYFTPMGVMRSGSQDIFGIGTYYDGNGTSEAINALINDAKSENGKHADSVDKKQVLPLSYDIDNYYEADTNSTNRFASKYYNGLSATSSSTGSSSLSRFSGADSSLAATHAQWEAVFIGNTEKNNTLFADYNTHKFGYGNITNPELGFKEFYTVTKVPLYASSSVLLGLTDEEIDKLIESGTIRFISENGNLLVRFDGIKITLKKSTLGKYLSFYVDVFDSHDAEGIEGGVAQNGGRIRVAVKVNDSEFSAASARDNTVGAANSYNKRGGKTERKTGQSEVIFEYKIKKGDALRISPYDLFYSVDTYNVNVFNSDGNLTDYNTVPVLEGEEGYSASYALSHKNMLAGINKNISVLAADDQYSVPVQTDDFHMRKIKITGVGQNPSVSGAFYAEPFYFEETRDYAEHFLLKANRKTTNDFMSFNFQVVSEGITVNAVVRVKVENSLPNIRDGILENTPVFNLSAKTGFTDNPSQSASGNSSSSESIATDKDGNELNYYVLDSYKYNVREFLLADLFSDPDNDTVTFKDVSTGIAVGTMKPDYAFNYDSYDSTKNNKDTLVNKESFVPFTGENASKFVKAYIGSGSNHRRGYNNCIILEGVSSTQGLPGGLWIKVEVSDEASNRGDFYRVYYFQVEVYNSEVEATDMQGMTLERLDPNNSNSETYVWKEAAEEDDKATHVVANAFNANNNTTVLSTAGSDASSTGVVKPMYIASNEKVMDYYVEAVLNAGANNKYAGFGYSNSQVKYIAQDPDGAQGLVLHGQGYDGSNPQTQTVKVVNKFDYSTDGNGPAFDIGNAVIVNKFYNTQYVNDLTFETYIAQNNVVQLLYFEDAATAATPDDIGNRITDPAKTNITTNWIVALNFTDVPDIVEVKLNLRDSNSVIAMPEGAPAATAGGHTVGAERLYSGVRSKYVSVSHNNETNQDEYSYNTGDVSIIDIKSYRFAIKLTSQGLYNNFTQWATSATKTYGGKEYSMNNAWSAKYKKDGVTEVLYYADKENDPDKFVSDNGIFRYENINVPAADEGSGKGVVGVPLSYFAWPSLNTAGSRGGNQSKFVWYDIDYGTSASLSQVYQAITLTDGYNTWTGNTLDNNPYVEIGLASSVDVGSSGTNAFGNYSQINATDNYLYGQQRFKLDQSGQRLNLSPVDSSNSGQYYFEDRYGLTFKKKDVRSVGTLYMELRLTQWSGTDRTPATKDGDDFDITVRVPINVANTTLQMSSGAGVKTIVPEKKVSIGGGTLSFVLSTNPADKDLYKNSEIISPAVIDDQSNFRNEAGLTYREDVYMLANSIGGNFTPTEMTYFKEALGVAAKVHANASARVLDNYFGVTGSTTAEKVANIDRVDTKQINKNYSNYFSIAPNSDSKTFSITPTRRTTFDYQSIVNDASLTTVTAKRNAVNAAAAERGLAVDFEGETAVVTGVYYPLKLIVYDRFILGYEATSTSFTSSSFDLLLIKLYIENSDPTSDTIILNEKITVPEKGENGATVSKAYDGRVLRLSSGGRGVNYNYTDLFYDADMVKDSKAQSYLTKSDVDKQGQLIKETADYPTQYDEATGEKTDWTTGIPAKVEFLEVGSGITNRYEATYNPDGSVQTESGAVECRASATELSISVKRRVAVMHNGFAAYIKITFADRDATNPCVIVFGVKISNAAPTLTTAASNLRTIEMRTGEYFTLYTTTFDNLKAGADAGSQTISYAPGASAENPVYAGNYIKMASSSNTAPTASQNLSGEYVPWTLQNGYKSGDGYTALPNLSGFNTAGNGWTNITIGGKTNIGYMAIAEDDAPWTLRFDPNAQPGRYGVNVSSPMIEPKMLNEVYFEGSKINTGYTAVMFEAKGVCTDAVVTITLIDGDATNKNETALGVELTFKITVVSTPPAPITKDTAGYTLGSSLDKFEGGAYKGRLTHFDPEIESRKYVYKLDMNVDEKITLKTSDFAYDVDSGDSDIMYLYNQSGNYPFEIFLAGATTGSGAFTDVTPNISVECSSAVPDITTRNTQFTITALNYHNTYNDYYDVLHFKICDGHTLASNDAIDVYLYVYVYPRGLSAKSKDAVDTKVESVAEYNQRKADAEEGDDSGNIVEVLGTEVPIVAANKGEALLADADVNASGTFYSVTLYTLNYFDENDKIAAYSIDDFDALLWKKNPTSEDKKAITDAEFAKFTYDNTGSSSSVSNGVNADIIRNYINDVVFSEDGSTVYFEPKKATNNVFLMFGDQRNGFHLYAKVVKYIHRSDGGNEGNSLIRSQSGAVMRVTVSNSAPVAVGNTGSNFNIRGDQNRYLSVNGHKGSYWDFHVYNTASKRDEALFRDLDGDAISYTGNYNIKKIYTLDPTTGDTKTTYYGNEIPALDNAAVKASADTAIRISQIRALEALGADGEPILDSDNNPYTFPGLRVEIANKIDLPASVPDADRLDVIYVEVELYGKDAESQASTVVTVGISNSAPTLIEEEDINEKYKTGMNSYTKVNGDAWLTLTLCKDDESKYITRNGEVMIPIMDLIVDADYSSDITQNKERFTFVSAQLMGTADLSDISGNPERTYWLGSGNPSYGYSTNNDELKNKRFLIREQESNTKLIFTVNSYERDASNEVVLVVMDSSGAKTGTLYITLVVGNSKPIDNASGKAAGNIALAGGANGGGNNGTFEPVTFSIFDFVSDNNPTDNEIIDKDNTDVRTYMRIVEYSPQEIVFNEAISKFDEYLVGGAGSGSGGVAGLDKPSELFTFSFSGDQAISIRPLKNLYGSQKINLTVSDGGNSDPNGSETIRITLEIHITANPNDMELNDLRVYYKRTKSVTAKDLFDRPNTDDDESTDISIVDLKINDGSSNIAEVSSVETNGVKDWRVTGKTNISGETVVASVTVVVGAQETRYTKEFNIIVDENKRPVFQVYKTSNGDQANWGDGINYISKVEFTDQNEGIYTIPITRIFLDEEGDPLKLISASSNKTTLIDVTANTQTNELIFHFKSRGDSRIKVKIADAVSEYSYTFYVGNTDLAAPNFFVGLISRVQENPLIFLIIAAAVLLFLILLIIIIAVARKKKRMREEIEALLVSEMELEEQMLKLAAGPSPTFYQSYGYLPPTQGTQNPGLMLGGGQGAPDPNAAIGLNPGMQQTPITGSPNQQVSPMDNGGFNDDDL